MAEFQLHSLGSRHESSEAPAAGQRLVLVMTVDSFSVRPFPDGAELVVGGSPGVDLRLEDEPAAAPRHLRLFTRAGRLFVEDLGSARGTLLHGAALPPGTPRAFLPGEAISVGGTVLMVREVMPQQPPRRILAHAGFEIRVQEECERARSGGADFSVLRLCATDANGHPLPAGTAPPTPVLTALAAAVPPPHVLGLYGRAELEALLVGQTGRAARTTVGSIRNALAAHGCGVRAALAQFPEDGTTADALLGRARARLFPPPPPWLPPGLAERVEAAGAHDDPLWLAGEPGVGKETLARAIHARSSRAERPFVVVEVGGTRPRGLDRALFGDGGSDGGAWFAARAGTLFLADLDLLPRTLLLQLIVGPPRDGGRPGDARPGPRIIGASAPLGGPGRSRHARQAIRALAAQLLELAPLRERVHDLEPLADHLVAAAAAARGRPAPPLGAEARRWLRREPWPGNLRQLDAVLDRTVAGADTAGELVLGAVDGAAGPDLLLVDR